MVEDQISYCKFELFPVINRIGMKRNVYQPYFFGQ